jgi:hypothetical protein
VNIKAICYRFNDDLESFSGRTGYFQIYYEVIIEGWETDDYILVNKSDNKIYRRVGDEAYHHWQNGGFFEIFPEYYTDEDDSGPDYGPVEGTWIPIDPFRLALMNAAEKERCLTNSLKRSIVTADE